jgi:hypothetical protein
MTDNKEQRPELTTGAGCHCPECATVARLLRAILDPRTGKTFRFYECPKCGHLWEYFFA